MMILNNINGLEIIEFLNSLDSDLIDMEGVSIIDKSYIFEKQIISDENYKLYFTASYNNWGTHQQISGNVIEIRKNGIVRLEEPIEYYGTAEFLENILSEFLKIYTFKSKPK